MEFIPLEKYSKTSKETPKKQTVQEKKQVKENVIKLEEVNKKEKVKPRPKILDKKKVKNKFKETLALKQKTKVQKKKTRKVQNEDGEVEKDNEKMETDEKVEGEVKDEDEDEAQALVKEEEDDEDEVAFKKKCQEIDDRNKNRLFVKLKKKILNETQIKEFHPDIKNVIFPRKKNTRWCWAVFVSQERAIKAFQQLKKREDVFVTLPIAHERNFRRQKEKMKTILRRKETRKKLQKMWM